MCVGPLAPKPQSFTPPALPKAAAPPPTAADPQVAQSRIQERQRAALAGRGGTVKTAGLGLLTPASTAKSTVRGV